MNEPTQVSMTLNPPTKDISTQHPLTQGFATQGSTTQGFATQHVHQNEYAQWFPPKGYYLSGKLYPTHMIVNHIQEGVFWGLAKFAAVSFIMLFLYWLAFHDSNGFIIIPVRFFVSPVL